MLIPKAEQRIEQYLNYLERNAYRKIADLEFEVFETGKSYRSPPADAQWKKITTPAPWGKEWTCFWFRAVYTAPQGALPLFLSVTPNADSLAFIDGLPAGAFNLYHHKLRIDADGKKHTLHVEAYSGHPHGGCGPFEGGSIVVNIGKTLPAFPNTFEGGCLLERRRAIHSLFYDIRALYETAKILDSHSLRKAMILKGLSEALAEISFNAQDEELEHQAAAASLSLIPLLMSRNSYSTPAIHLIGHAHIDHAWLWPIAETERKAARTFANMIRFMKEYPEFIFLQSQSCQLEIIKNKYPDIFKGVRDAYQNGKWEPNGGMFVEADCNIPSGESLIRQFLVGKKVNKELLNYEADTLWLPDVFGFPAALPQIMAGCRIKYFVTSKISWNDTTRFPYETFIWRGIDGTGIRAHLIVGTYNARVAPQQLAGFWNEVQHKEIQSACVVSAGEGDGGGGTLRSDLEMTRRLGDLEGSPRCAWKKLSAALDEIFDDNTEFPEWRGELYLELHRGTYTTQSRAKRDNRRLEFSLRNAEFFCAFAALETLYEYPREVLFDCWKRALTYQFHDIIPGSSIGKVYAEAGSDSREMLNLLAGLSDDAQKHLTGQTSQVIKTGLTGQTNNIFVFNDLSWERTDAVHIPANQMEGIAAVQDNNGTTYPVQRYTDLDGNEQAVFSPGTPSLGWARFVPVTRYIDAPSPFLWQENTLQTPFHTIMFDTLGRITSFITRGKKREFVAPGGAFNHFIIAEDVPVFWDAWDIEADWTRHIIKKEIRLVDTHVAAWGPVCFRLRRSYEIGAASRMEQDMVCYANNPRIDFETKVFWREKWRLLKVEFDTAITADRVRSEIQYGHIMRNTHRSTMEDRAKFEICAHKWISLEEEGCGIALLNDCKYGHDVEHGKMRLSLLRSPIAPDPEADRGEHHFTYAILPYSGHFGESGVIRAGNELNSPVTALVAVGAVASDVPAARSFCTVDGNAVIVESVKMPENGSPGEVIVRLYESLGGRTRTVLRFSRELRRAARTDMLEDNPQNLPIQGRSLALEFKPFEIITLRVAF